VAGQIGSSANYRSGRRLNILLTNHDHARHRSLMTELLGRAHSHHLAGVTVLQALEGYGASGEIHRRHLLSDDAPMTMVFIDEPGKIDAFLASVENLLATELVIIDDVDIIDV
jgi:uncharacterized protein